MTVSKLQHYLDELVALDMKFDTEVVAAFKSKAEDFFGVSENKCKFLAEKVLHEHADRFATEAARQDLSRFLVQQVKSKDYPWDPFFKIFDSIPGLSNCWAEACLGQSYPIFKDGRASPEYIQKVRQNSVAPDFRGTASLAKIPPQCDEMATIEAAMSKTVKAIQGFDFLSQPPQGMHTILIKPGVNWGQFGYPTVTSWQSVYALTKICFQEAKKRKASVEIIVADESGIIYDAFGITTMENLEQTGIFSAAILAGLEQAALMEESQHGDFDGAGDLLALAKSGHKITRSRKDEKSVQMREMARRAGVRVAAFDKLDRQQVFIPGARHFTEGVLIPKIIMEEVTDIINLPKPPGRHLIMGNSGLTGAIKNHIGILAKEQRCPGLHGLHDRYPPPKRGESEQSYLENLTRRQGLLKEKGGGAARKYAIDVIANWKISAPALPFHEKVVELYAVVADKERFSVTDMRRTISSIGPDLGNTLDVGAVIAAKDPMTLDIFAGALLKLAYVNIGSALDALAPGGDTLLECLVGKTWLKHGTPFDLMSNIAANSYGFGPLDAAHIDLKGVEDSGFNDAEIEAINSILRGE